MKHVKKFEGVFDEIIDDYTVENAVNYLLEYWNLDPDEFVVYDNNIKDVIYTEISMPPHGNKKLSVDILVSTTDVTVTLLINGTNFERDRFSGASTVETLFENQIDKLLQSYNKDFDFVQHLNRENVEMEAKIEDNNSSISERIVGIKTDRNFDQHRKEPRYPNRVV